MKHYQTLFQGYNDFVRKKKTKNIFNLKDFKETLQNEILEHCYVIVLLIIMQSFFKKDLSFKLSLMNNLQGTSELIYLNNLKTQTREQKHRNRLFIF